MNDMAFLASNLIDHAGGLKNTRPDDSIGLYEAPIDLTSRRLDSLRLRPSFLAGTSISSSGNNDTRNLTTILSGQS
jgi:hypothetical protein